MLVKNLFRFLYRQLPCKRELIMATRFFGIGRFLPKRFKSYLVFCGSFSVDLMGKKFFMVNGYGREIEAAVFWDGLDAFEGETLSCWMALCKRSRFIVDVGANTGIYSLVAKTCNLEAEVHAFEPIDRVYERLEETLKYNNFLGVPSIIPHCIALSDYSGEGLMYDLPVEHMYTASLNKNIHEQRGNQTKATTQKVSVQRLDDFFTAVNWQHVDLIKIDVESHEPQVLRGMGSWLGDCQPSIVIEIWDNSVGQAVEEIVKDINYHYYMLTSDGVKRTYEIRNEYPEKGYINYLLCTNEIACSLGLV